MRGSDWADDAFASRHDVVRRFTPPCQLLELTTFQPDSCRLGWCFVFCSEHSAFWRSRGAARKRQPVSPALSRLLAVAKDLRKTSTRLLRVLQAWVGEHQSLNCRYPAGTPAPRYRWPRRILMKTASRTYALVMPDH